MGTPNCAGSNGLCPPAGTRLPPTNATLASEYTDANSPIVSSSTISPGRIGSDALALHSDRRVHRFPDFSSSAATAANRSGCRGARTSANCASPLSSRGHASSRAASSPSSVLPATRKRSPADFALNSRVASASSAARTSNFRFPATAARSGAQPTASRRSASVWLWARTAPSRPSSGFHNRRSIL